MNRLEEEPSDANSFREPNRSPLAPHLVLVVVQILFGTWPILGKIALRSMSSTALVGFRIVGGALVFALLHRKLDAVRRLPKRVIGELLLSSLLGVVVNQLLFVKGLSLTTVINATLLTTTIPVFTLAVSIGLGHDHPSARHILGIVLAVSGVVYLVDPLRASFTAQTTLGNILIIINSLCYGAYIAVSGTLVKRYGAFNVIAWLFFIAGIVTFPIAAYAWSGEQFGSTPASAWLSVAYIVLVPTVAVYYLNAWALMRITPGVVAMYIYLQPLLAFGLAPLVLGESWNSRTVVACVLIFAGVAIVTMRNRSVAVEEVSEHPDALAH